MGGFSWLVPRPAAAGDPTHALFAAQSHSIVDNLVALLRHSRAWNCSGAERVLGNTSRSAERETHCNNVCYLRSFGKQIPIRSFTTRDPKPTSRRGARMWAAKRGAVPRTVRFEADRG